MQENGAFPALLPPRPTARRLPSVEELAVVRATATRRHGIDPTICGDCGERGRMVPLAGLCVACYAAALKGWAA